MSKKKIILIILASVLGLTIASTCGIYFYGVSRYKAQFLKGTLINGVDCSDLAPSAVCEILDGQISDYVLEVSGRNPKNPEEIMVLGTITPADVSLHRKDTQALVEDVFAQQNPYQWYKMYWSHDNAYEFQQEIAFEPEQLVSFVGSWEACAGNTAVEPQDAYVSEYLPDENAYRVVPETRGSRMDVNVAVPAIEQALYAMAKQVDIEDTGCYRSAKIKADDESLNAVVNQVNSWLGAKIDYNWYGTELSVGPAELSQWVSLVDGEPVLDEEAVEEFVNYAKKEYDPNGHRYTFRTSLGVDLSLKCKSGWTTDPEKESQELIELIKEGAVTERQPVSKTENYVFFDGNIGGSYAEVDLTNQHMYFYYEGELLLETDFVSGDVATGHATPEGIFAVTFTARDRILRGPDYESFVHYWMPFYGGYGMHDAMWRKVFGGKIYLNNGSHGCVNLPLEKAETIFGCVKTGFPVICYYYPEGKNPVELRAVETAGNVENTPEAEAEGNGGETGQENPDAASGGEGASQEPLEEENEIRGRW